jgi:hypothetical protein
MLYCIENNSHTFSRVELYILYFIFVKCKIFTTLCIYNIQNTLFFKVFKRRSRPLSVSLLYDVINEFTVFKYVYDYFKASNLKFDSTQII